MLTYWRSVKEILTISFNYKHELSIKINELCDVMRAEFLLLVEQVKIEVQFGYDL